MSKCGDVGQAAAQRQEHGPTTALEALIAEALGEVALLLDRVEILISSMEVERLALANASAELSGGAAHAHV